MITKSSTEEFVHTHCDDGTQLGRDIIRKIKRRTACVLAEKLTIAAIIDVLKEHLKELERA